MMKKVLITLGMVGWLFLGNGFAEETIRLTTGDWYPFVSESLKDKGIFSRIVTESLAIEGINVEYTFFPWERAYDSAKFGDYDGSSCYSWTKEREKYFYYSEPMYIEKDVFFHLKSYKFDWNTFDDLKGIAIGGTIGYDYGPKFQEGEKSGKLDVQRVPTDEQNFRKLLNNRIKLFINSFEAGYGNIHQNFKQKAHLITYHPKPSLTSNYYLILSKKHDKNKRILALFNKGLKQLKESGKYDQYLEESRRQASTVKK